MIQRENVNVLHILQKKVLFLSRFSSHICIFGVPTLCATKCIDAYRFVFSFEMFSLGNDTSQILYYQFSSTLNVFVELVIALFQYSSFSNFAFINNCILLLCSFDQITDKGLVTHERKCKRA